MNGAQSKGIEPRSKQVRNLKYTVQTVVGEFVAPSWTSDFVTNIVMVSPGRARD